MFNLEFRTALRPIKKTRKSQQKQKVNVLKVNNNKILISIYKTQEFLWFVGINKTVI